MRVTLVFQSSACDVVFREHLDPGDYLHERWIGFPGESKSSLQQFQFSVDCRVCRILALPLQLVRRDVFGSEVSRQEITEERYQIFFGPAPAFRQTSLLMKRVVVEEI